MKNFILAFALVLIVSCSGDDSPTVKNYPESIAGTWKSISFTNKGKTIDTSNCDNVDNDAVYWTFVFKNDKTFDILNSCDITSPTGENGTFTYSKGILTNTHEGNWINKYNVTTLSANKISIKLFWSSSTNSIDGEYMILEKQ